MNLLVHLHLKVYSLSTSGNKTALINRLHDFFTPPRVITCHVEASSKDLSSPPLHQTEQLTGIYYNTLREWAHTPFEVLFYAFFMENPVMSFVAGFCSKVL